MPLLAAMIFAGVCLIIFGGSFILAGGLLYIMATGLKVGFFALCVWLPIAMVRWIMGK